MTAKPVDAAGDILPVLRPDDLLSGAEAAAAGLRDHLALFAGDWWETPEAGNELPELIASSRLTEQDLPVLSGYLCALTQAFPGVVSVESASAALSGHRLSWRAAARLSDGSEVPVSLTV